MRSSWHICLLSLCVVGSQLGCSHFGSDTDKERRVRIHGVVEAYDAAALVFRELDTIPYDSTSHISWIRVDKPQSLRGRLITIDLSEAKPKIDEDWSEFRIEGSVVSFQVPEKLITANQKSLIPVASVTK